MVLRVGLISRYTEFDSLLPKFVRLGFADGRWIAEVLTTVVISEQLDEGGARFICYWAAPRPVSEKDL